MNKYTISDKNWQESILPPTATIEQACKVMKYSTMGFVLVLDNKGRLLGILTRNDFRKGLIKRVCLCDKVTEIMNPCPYTIKENETKEAISAFFQKTSLMHLPVIDDDRKVVRVDYCDGHTKIAEEDNWAIIMAGGLGKRLRPLTEDVPKPLLKVGSKPILEKIIENCVKSGFKKVFLSVNYKSEMIKEAFGNGSDWGITIEYIEETKKLGTAGALSLLPARPPKTILVMNGDLLTDLNFQELMHFHMEHKVSATMCVKEYEFSVPFGVVNVGSSNNKIIGIDEKPVQKFFINAGIYLLEPEVLEDVAKNSYLDMPDLFKILLKKEKSTSVFPIHEYWLDIGRIEDYKKANNGDIRRKSHA